MADTQTPTVNSQITDAITQTNVSVVGKAPAQSMAMVYQSMAHATSLLMQNSVTAQSGMQQINSAVVASACQRIMSLSSQRVALTPPSLTIAPGPLPEGKQEEEDKKQSGDDKLQFPTTNGISDDQYKKIVRSAADKATKAAEAASQASSDYNEAQEKAEDILRNAKPDESSLEKAKTASSIAHNAAKESKKASQASEKADALYSKIFDSKDMDEIKRYARQLIQEQIKTEAARDKVKEYKQQIEDLQGEDF